MTDANRKRHYRILVRDLNVPWSIGVFDHEYEKVQMVKINLELESDEMLDPDSDDFDQVACYATISEKIRMLASTGHIKLVETLAHRIGLLCLDDSHIQTAIVRVEKPEALKNALSVGVEITRTRKDLEIFN